jgi:hypothetical protein
MNSTSLWSVVVSGAWVYYVSQNMVGVAQLVEHPVVVRDVAGSSPVAHPIQI